MIIGYARCSTADQNLDWQVRWYLAIGASGFEMLYRIKILIPAAFFTLGNSF